MLAAAIALGVGAAGAASAADFSTSFEAGQRQARAGDSGIELYVGNGPAEPYAAKPNAGYSGAKALRYAAKAGGRSTLFDVDVTVGADTTLAWLVLPEIVGEDTVASTYVSLDAVLDDGTRVSANGARDQHGFALGAQAQGDSKSLYPQQWARKAVRLGDVPALRGKRVVAIEVEVRPAAGKPAQGWIDDVSLDDAPIAARKAPTDWVLTTRGTQANGRFSRGNNFPATAVPHGFNFWTPATDAGTLSWLYSWNEKNDAANRPRLQALSLSHQPSPWMADRQTFQVMPSSSRGVPEADRQKRALSFSHANEVARPQRYSVRFDNGIAASLAPTDHAALFEFSFPGQADANLLFDNVDARGGLSLDPQTQTLSGYTDVRSGLSTGATRMFVHASFDAPWQRSGMIDTGRPTGYVKFAAPQQGDGTRKVTMRIATSLISLEQARRNLALEVADGDTVDSVAARAQQRWDALLGVLEVDGASEDQRTTVYSNLYRLFLYPNSGSENAGSAAQPDWRYASQNSGSDDNTDGSAVRSFAPVRDGRIYVNNGLWDTFRTAWPAYGLLAPDSAGGLIDGFLEQYRAGGWVARWSSPGYADLMVGTSSDVAFADAWAKGIGGFDPALAYEAALKNATVVPPDRHVGRKGMARSTFRGYVDTDTHEGMSWTLEGALNDFGIAALAEGLARQAGSPQDRRRYAEEAAYFRYRAASYANVFDRNVDFFQGRTPDGSWRLSPQDYDPRVWGHDYTESSGWTFAFTAAHDGNGLAALYGGRDALAKKLDAFFATPETAQARFAGSYGGLIHEMIEARDVRMGMYAHSNQTAHHIAWMYLYAGQPWKTQALTREVLARQYLGSEIGQGYPGDEDNGEMSAWYVLAAMGLYPLRMGSPDYVIGSPLFRQATLKQPGGRQLLVRAQNNSPENVYVQSLKVNGKPWTRTWIPHRLLAQGATLDFVMGPQPSRWGAAPEDAPPSLTPAGQAPQTLLDVIDTAARVTVQRADGAALVDDDARTALPLAGKPYEVDIALGASAQPVFYTLTSGERPIAGASWTLEARSGNQGWKVIDTRSGETFRWSLQTRPFRIAAPGRFDAYRLRFTAPGRIQLAEVELLAPHTPVALKEP
ncbi:GH92 family glycosyl hydrolase [Xanthomonas sp. AmX2]|uniref:GH92 family glycosyl hydrolase n=1 Tax=Xanthomonas sp. TaxID=29446 RepID=UPI00197FFCB6|nr:GH92 family glycosyl hydrolase [Xanthomonas sp.]MBN6150714.1 GH92 family glycosyl hydrolase [Xanthomonas sp.]